MINVLPCAVTVTEIARRLGEPVDRVRYVIRSRNLSPKTRAGNCGIYAESDVERIATELRQIDAGRGVLA